MLDEHYLFFCFCFCDVEPAVCNKKRHLLIRRYIEHQESDSEFCLYFLLQTLTNVQVKPITAMRMPLVQIPRARSTALAFLDTLKMVGIVKVGVSFIPLTL